MNATVSTLRALLHPCGVAVYGASRDPGKFDGRVMRFLLQHGYRGGHRADVRPLRGGRRRQIHVSRGQDRLYRCLDCRARRAHSAQGRNGTDAGRQLDAAMEYARQLADNAPLVVSVLRDYVGRVIPKGPSELAAQDRASIQRIRQSADAKEGITSFRENANPDFPENNQ